MGYAYLSVKHYSAGNMDKQYIEKMDKIPAFDQAAAIFAANGTDISKPIMRLMSPLLDQTMTLEEHRAFLKSQLSEMKE